MLTKIKRWLFCYWKCLRLTQWNKINANFRLREGINDAREANEKIISQAAQIAVCWSRAWGSGGAAATAFHVRPSQVSKQTESGESLGRVVLSSGVSVHGTEI